MFSILTLFGSVAPLFFDLFQFIVGLWVGRSVDEAEDGCRDGVDIQQSAEAAKAKF